MALERSVSTLELLNEWFKLTSSLESFSGLAGYTRHYLHPSYFNRENLTFQNLPPVNIACSSAYIFCIGTMDETGGGPLRDIRAGLEKIANEEMRGYIISFDLGGSRNAIGIKNTITADIVKRAIAQLHATNSLSPASPTPNGPALAPAAPVASLPPMGPPGGPSLLPAETSSVTVALVSRPSAPVAPKREAKPSFWQSPASEVGDKGGSLTPATKYRAISCMPER